MLLPPVPSSPHPAPQVDVVGFNTGFNLTARDQLDFIKYLADTAHSLGLAFGLKVRWSIGSLGTGRWSQVWSRVRCTQSGSGLWAQGGVHTGLRRSREKVRLTANCTWRGKGGGGTQGLTACSRHSAQPGTGHWAQGGVHSGLAGGGERRVLGHHAASDDTMQNAANRCFPAMPPSLFSPCLHPLPALSLYRSLFLLHLFALCCCQLHMSFPQLALPSHRTHPPLFPPGPVFTPPQNTILQVKDLASSVDFAVNEECAQYNECQYYQPMRRAGKPVFNMCVWC